MVNLSLGRSVNNLPLYYFVRLSILQFPLLFPTADRVNDLILSSEFEIPKIKPKSLFYSKSARTDKILSGISFFLGSFKNLLNNRTMNALTKYYKFYFKFIF